MLRQTYTVSFLHRLYISIKPCAKRFRPLNQTTEPKKKKKKVVIAIATPVWGSHRKVTVSIISLIEGKDVIVTNDHLVSDAELCKKALFGAKMGWSHNIFWRIALWKRPIKSSLHLPAQFCTNYCNDPERVGFLLCRHRLHPDRCWAPKNPLSRQRAGEELSTFSISQELSNCIQGMRPKSASWRKRPTKGFQPQQSWVFPPQPAPETTPSPGSLELLNRDHPWCWNSQQQPQETSTCQGLCRQNDGRCLPESCKVQAGREPKCCAASCRAGQKKGGKSSLDYEGMWFPRA